MRTFVALELPAQFAEETEQLARALKGSVQGRFMKPETYHLTLAFLGEVDEAQVASAMDALDAIAGIGTVSLVPEGLGTFKQRKEHTLYLALQRAPELMALARDMRDELRARGLEFDGKKFLPHITLARRAQVAAGSLEQLPFPTEAIGHTITLFKSELSSEGATYKPLYSIELNQAAVSQ